MISRRQFVAGAAVTAGLVGCRASLRGRTVREVTRAVQGVPSRDGAGVNLRRMLGSRELPLCDPFLLLDEIHSDRAEDWIAGFPDHPHRGFETVSILLRGAFEHRDSVGNHGRIADGGAQWMTAGHGIVHAEMPRQSPGLDLWGLQLWVNLPARLKRTRPRYQDLTAGQVPSVDLGDGRARLVAGRIGARRGPVDGIFVDPTLVDLELPARGRAVHDLPGTHTALMHVLAGEALVGGARTPVMAGQLAVLSAGDRLLVASDIGARLLVFAGAPIGEPVARRGPFVMNTEAELDQAVADYRSGRLVADALDAVRSR